MDLSDRFEDQPEGWSSSQTEVRVIIWEYLRWAIRRRVPQLILKCVLGLMVAVLASWIAGVLFAAFARGFFWGVKLWMER